MALAGRDLTRCARDPVGARHIGWPGLTPNASWNSGMFASGPSTRHFAGACTSLSSDAAQPRLALLDQPAERVAEEVALHRREAADLLALLVLLGLLERVEAEQHAAVVGDVLAEARLAVDVQAGQRLVGVELLRPSPARARSNFAASSSVHQSCEVALRVELPALVVEAVRDLVADGATRPRSRRRRRRRRRRPSTPGIVKMAAGRTISLFDGL